jgi:hypothetical protein
MTLAERTMGGVVHDQERCALFDAEFQHADDMRVGELRDSARLGEELVERAVGQANLEDFDGCRCLEIDMPGQVDLGEAPLAEELQQLVITQSLSYVVSHRKTPPFGVYHA